MSDVQSTQFGENNTTDNTFTETQEHEAKMLADSENGPEVTKTENTSETPSFEAKADTKTEKQAKAAKKPKKVVKTFPARTDEEIEAAKKDLLGLQAEKSIIDNSDRKIVAKMLAEIETLKDSGISYSTIHKAACKRLNLQISLSTFVVYVQAAKAQRDGRAEAKTVKISVPVQFKDKFEKIVQGIEHESSIACTFFNKEGKNIGVVKIGEVPTMHQSQNN